jgi:hypothetical protein
MALPKEDGYIQIIEENSRTITDLRNFIRALEEHKGVDHKYSHNECGKCGQTRFRAWDTKVAADGTTVVETIQCVACDTVHLLCCMCNNLAEEDSDVCEKYLAEIAADKREEERISREYSPFKKDRYED